MRIVVGGQCRKAGKTTVVCRLLRGFPDVAWTVVKISGHGHGHGLEPGVWVMEEEAGEPCSDTARYREAGAARALWLRGHVEGALPALRERLARAPHWIVESTRAAAWLEHDLAILVLDPNKTEIKDYVLGFPEGPRVVAGEPGLIELAALCWKP